MSATIWIDTPNEVTLDLGGTLQLYAIFQEMAKVAGKGFAKTYPELFGVPSQTEDTADADRGWLADVIKQAGQYLADHGDKVSPMAKDLLRQLADYKPPAADKSAAPDILDYL